MILICEMEPNNRHSKYAVVVKNEDDRIVGHVPIELSKLFFEFLSEYGKIEAECIGSRINKGRGKGLELPVDFRLVGNARYLKKLLKKLQKKNIEFDYQWKLSKIQKC